MYAIVNIVYGVPLNLNVRGAKSNDWSEELEDAVDNEDDGFITYYRGAGDCTPAAFGIVLDEFDECAHHTEVDQLTLTASLIVQSKYSTMFQNLSPTLQTQLEKYGQPRVLFLWSSS